MGGRTPAILLQRVESSGKEETGRLRTAGTPSQILCASGPCDRRLRAQIKLLKAEKRYSTILSSCCIPHPHTSLVLARLPLPTITPV